MKRFTYAGLILFLTVGAATAQLTGYTNYGQIVSPINIDATNFVNLGEFSFSISGYQNDPYTFADVLTFTNRGTMSIDNGYNFDTQAPTQFPYPLETPALVFVNQNPGQIHAGSTVTTTSGTVTVTTTSSSTVPPIINVWANSVTNTGTIGVGQAGLISLTGNNLELARGTLNVDGLGQLQGSNLAANGFLLEGQFDEDWNVATQNSAITTNGRPLAPISSGVPYIFETPNHAVITQSGTTNTESFDVENAVFAAYTNYVSPSNIVTQVIIAGDLLGLVNVTVGFTNVGADTQGAVVAWSGVSQGGQTTSFYLEDLLGSISNVTLFTNNTSLTGVPLLMPTNYEFFTGVPSNAVFSNTTYSFNLFTNAFQGRQRETNLFTALDLNMDSVTSEPDPTIPGSTYSNQPGRIEINAGTLDLSNSVLNAGNFLNLNVTNFIGNPTASVSFSRGSLNLGSTSGRLTITNLVPPSVPLFSGPIECYSAMWTNVIQVTNVTGPQTNLTTNVFSSSNIFTLLMVSSELEPDSPVYLQDFTLNSTNVILSDTFIVLSNFFVNAQNLTLTANGPGALSPYAELEVESIDTLWTPYLPNLQNLTNQGIIFVANNAIFQNRHNPAFRSANDSPLQSFVNTGVLETGGGQDIWANFFENVGPSTAIGITEIYSGVGPIFIQSPTAIFAGSDTVASDGDMQITAGALVVSNVILEASGSLTLSATNFLTDGGGVSTYYAGDGFSVQVMPTGGAASNSLRSTTINNSCLPNVQSENVWAGRPTTLGASGFTNSLPAMANNAPIGQLILTGESSNSVFHFAGPDAVNQYAMYVDQLDLEGGAVQRKNIGGTNIWTGLNIDPNVTIYYLDAVSTNGVDISEKLNGANGGHLVWISNYVGQFSGITLTYPDGRSFVFNRALAQSLTIDSDGDGLVNGIDPTPFPEPQPQVLQLNAKTKLAAGVASVDISWTAPAYSTNTLQYRTMPGTNWLTFTNFVQGPADGTATVNDVVHTNSRQFRLLVNPLQ